LNQGPVLTNNAVVNCETPFNIQEVARNAAGFIDRIDGTAQRLNEAIADVRRLVLNEETLTNLAGSIGTMRRASEHALSAVDNLNALIDTNRPAVAEALSNVVYFSDQINSFADKFGDVLTTNSTELTTSMKNISASSMALKSILDDAQSGKGLIGTVLKNDVLATNVAAIAENLSITSSNLNSLGLWRVLFPKHPKSNTPPAH
jgi:ABC-type transporter Mla subunit MlaD